MSPRLLPAGMTSPVPVPIAATNAPACIAIVGPTASGKTSLAIAVAERLDAEIISADSMQFYRGMEIGAAAPTAEECARVPHHFVRFLDPNETMAAGDYQRLARERIQALAASGKGAVIVGGSGLYISALIDGLFDGPPRDEAVRARLKAEAAEHGNAHLYARLEQVDPDYAAVLTSENDLVRMIRALEVHETTGVSYSRLHREHRERTGEWLVPQWGLAWDRAALYERIEQRVEAMIAAGWVEEVRTLLDRGYGPDIERLKALGFREIAAVLRGEQELDAAVAAVKMHHRRYAKRQLTWFRGDARVAWLDVEETMSPEALVERIVRFM